MSENTLGKQIQLIASQMGHRLFRMNSGMAWAGKVLHFSKPCSITVMPGDVVIRKAYPIRFGIEGMCDYGGWTNKGRTLWAEIKMEAGKPTNEQINFIQQVKNSDGIAGIIRSEEDAIKLFS